MSSMQEKIEAFQRREKRRADQRAKLEPVVQAIGEVLRVDAASEATFDAAIEAAKKALEEQGIAL